MRRILFVAVLASLSVGTAACTDSERARNSATFADQPADIMCWTYGTENFRGRSTGKVEYDEGGRISFVDAANGRLTTVEGDCRVTYLNKDEAETTPPSAPLEPVAPVGPVSPSAAE